MTPDPSRDDGVLEPEDLEIEPDGERVDRIDEHRFVVRPDADEASSERNGPADDTVGSADDTVGSADDTVDSADDTVGSGEVDDAVDPSTALSLAESSAPHGVEITLKTDGELASHRVTSHDVREVFSELLAWYARQLDDDLSPTETLRVLLAPTDLED